ncbi:hypothetical protein PanWU01x14_172930, partial [Parasponia andersonii]
MPDRRRRRHRHCLSAQLTGGASPCDTKPRSLSLVAAVACNARKTPRGRIGFLDVGDDSGHHSTSNR